MLSLLLAAALILSCGKTPVQPGHDIVDPPQPEDSTQTQPPVEEPKDSVLCAPKNLTLSVEAGNIVLEWEDVCAVEAGYLVQRTCGSDVQKQFLKRNATSYTEAVPGKGNYLYEVCSYSGMERSESVSVTYSDLDTPKLSISSAQASWQAVGVVVNLEDGCGEKCTVTLEVDGVGYASQAKVGAGENALFTVNDLSYGADHTIRASATNSQGTSWTSKKTVKLLDAPTALSVAWTEISSDYQMPSGVKLYKASSSVTGRNVNMWYAIADMSQVELRTSLAGALTTPTAWVSASSDEEIITVNGGYFGSPNTSYSHITDRGTRKAKNIGALTRTYSYNVTRGAFGVDESGKPEIYWIYDESSSTSAYETPLPVVDGGAVLSHTDNYPSKKIMWKPYSAVGGAPVLLRDGRIRFDFLKTPGEKYFSNHELLQSDIFADGLRAPRTAMGFTAEGKIILFVCDGRDSGGSKGLTLDEMTRILMGLGCTDALNLDGGGSTAMVAGNDGKLLNVPSDGQQRKVLQFVSFVKK